MQFWVNEEGQMLSVADVTKIRGSEYYGKRVKHNRYVVNYALSLSQSTSQYNMSLSFDKMSGVRFWLSNFGYKLIQEDRTYA